MVTHTHTLSLSHAQKNKLCPKDNTPQIISTLLFSAVYDDCGRLFSPLQQQQQHYEEKQQRC
jgi:hypothetical protein